MTDHSAKEQETVQKIVRTKIYTSADIKALKTLTFDNIVICKEYLRQSNNTTPKALPINIWITADDQYLIEQRLKFLQVEDWENWKSKHYLDWLIPTLKEAFPSNPRSTSTAPPSERVTELRSLFANIDIFKAKTMHDLVKRMRENFVSPAA